MKAFALAILIALPALGAAQAETWVSGFHPRFGSVPNPTYADNPDYRPPHREQNRFDFSIGVDVFGDGDRDCRGRHCRSGRDRDNRNHRRSN